MPESKYSGNPFGSAVYVCQGIRLKVCSLCGLCFGLGLDIFQGFEYLFPKGREYMNFVAEFPFLSG